eukprot:g20071.t1
MDLGLTGKRALVLASSRGLGLGIATALAREGVAVLLVGRSGERLAENCAAINAEARGKADWVWGDLSEENFVAAMEAAVKSKLGGIDILVNNTGGPTPGGTQDMSAEKLDGFFQSMVLRVITLTNAFLPQMKEQGWGRVLTVASSGVVEPIANLALSNTLRGALAGWNKTLATEVASFGITANMLLPGRIHTDRIDELDAANAKRLGKSMEETRAASLNAIPAGRLGKVEEFAAAGAFLCSEPASRRRSIRSAFHEARKIGNQRIANRVADRLVRVAPGVDQQPREDHRPVPLLRPAHEPADRPVAIRFAGRPAHRSGTGLAVNRPTVGGGKFRNDRPRLFRRSFGDRQTAGEEPAEEIDLLVGRDRQRRHQPGLRQPVRAARATADVAVAVAEPGDVFGKDPAPQPPRELLRIPDDRVPLPDLRIRRLALALRTVELRLVVPARRMRILQHAGIETHHSERQLEGGLGVDSLVAVALPVQRGAARGIEDDRAAQRVFASGRSRWNEACGSQGCGGQAERNGKTAKISKGHERAPAAARHLSFTRAAIELNVTQAAVSHQVKLLEERLGATLFRRLPRGLMITEEGLALLPALKESFDRMADLLERFEAGQVRQVLKIGAVGTFAVGWLMPRLAEFSQRHAFVDLRLSTNNNRVDIAAEGLDYTIRFGNGAWHDIEAEELFSAPLSPLCVPAIAAELASPQDVAQRVLLRSYRSDEWLRWFAAARVEAPPIRGPVFDSSVLMVEAALQGAGVALAPPLMFSRLIREGALQQPFSVSVVQGSYWLTRLKSRAATPAMEAFRGWLAGEAALTRGRTA